MNRITAEQVDAVFEAAADQQEAIIALHKLVVPSWDDVEKLDDYVSCGEELWLYVCRKAIAMDSVLHPNCVPGGAWLNWGFSCDKKLRPYAVRLPRITYHKAQTQEPVHV